MTRKQETGMAIVVITVVIILLFLTSCSTKKSVTEYIYVHDTLTTLKVDTIKDVRVSVRHDTIRERETHTYTVNDVGDTIREIHHYHESEMFIFIDSTDRYRAVVDSLQRIVDSQKQKEVVKKEPWYKRWQGELFLLAVVFVLCVFILKSRTK